MFLVVSSCSCLRSIHWSQVLSWEWRCSWSNADRRCSNYELSTFFLPAKVRLILEVLRQGHAMECKSLTWCSIAHSVLSAGYRFLRHCRGTNPGLTTGGLVCSTSLMALLIRSIGGLSKYFYQGLRLAVLSADVIGQSINRHGVA